MHRLAAPALTRAARLLCAAACIVSAQAQGQVQAPVLASTQPAPKASPPPAAMPGAPANEPSVQRHVVDDGNARIDELNVRGAVRSITVSPKGPITVPYEVLPTDASVDPSDGPATTKGAQGRRVWRVLSF